MPYHACARRRWRRRLAGAGAGAGPGSGLGPGPGPGPGSGLGLGLGSLPGLVLFESGLKGMGRSATRTRPALLRDPTRYLDPKLQLDSQRSQLLNSQQVRLLGRTVATVQTEPLQPFVGFEPVVKHSHLSIERHQHQIRSERGIRKFNRFFYRIVV